MIKLVKIETTREGDFSYTRYDGRTKTHNGVNGKPLSAEDVELFRTNPDGTWEPEAA